MLKRVVNLPFKVLGKAARALQEREDAVMRQRYEEAVVSDEAAEAEHVPKFDVPDDYYPDDMALNVGAAQDLVDHRKGVYIDVRNGNRDHQLRGTQHLPLQTLDIRLAELPPAGTPIVVYGDSDEQAILATRFLRFRGIDEAWYIDGGLAAWLADDGVVEDAS